MIEVRLATAVDVVVFFIDRLRSFMALGVLCLERKCSRRLALLLVSFASISCMSGRSMEGRPPLGLAECDWVLIHEWHDGPNDEVRELWRAGPLHIIMDAEGRFVSAPIEGMGGQSGAGEVGHVRAQAFLESVSKLVGSDSVLFEPDRPEFNGARYVMISFVRSGQAQTVVFPVHMQANSDRLRELYLLVQSIRRDVADSILGGSGF